MQVQGELELWARLERRSELGELNGRPIRVCSFEDLIELKNDAGRPQDLVDIAQLRVARGERD